MKQSRTEQSIEIKEEPLTILQDITFSNVPYWFPQFHYKALRMNLICPFHPAKEKKYPVLVWICGGAWITMEKAAHTPFLIQLARKGYIIASIEYRMSGTKHFPAQIEDVKSAIRYLRAHAEEFHIDSDRIAVGGESAGGHLAALAGVTGGEKEFDRGENLDRSSSVCAVLDFYGPSTFLPEEKKQIEETEAAEPVGATETVKAADSAASVPGETCAADETPTPSEAPSPDEAPSPVVMLLGYEPTRHPQKAARAAALSYVSAATPPFFIIHGQADHVVSVGNSRRLADHLGKNGCSYELLEVKEADHADPRIYQGDTVERVDAFLRRVFAQPFRPFQNRECITGEPGEGFMTMVENLVYTQRPYWFPFYNYKDLKMDLMLPLGAEKEKKHPLLVWFGGGGFLTMEKAAFLPWLLYFVQKGYVVASAEYRLSNVAPFPAPLEDAKSAIRFLRAHAEEFGIDKDRVVVGGESAGGMLAAMTALHGESRDYDTGDNLQESSAVQGLIDFYGPASVLAEATQSKEEESIKPMPSVEVGPHTPPVFMAHGTADTLVDCGRSDDFYEKLCEKDIPVEYLVVKDAPHMGMEFYQKEIAEGIMTFFRENAGGTLRRI